MTDLEMKLIEVVVALLSVLLFKGGAVEPRHPFRDLVVLAAWGTPLPSGSWRGRRVADGIPPRYDAPADMTSSTIEVRRPPRALGRWMLSNFTVGAGYSAFVSLLVPPFVKEVTGDASAAAIVMGIIAFGALLGPAIGSFADSYSAHHIVPIGGVGAMALAFVMCAISAETPVLYALDTIAMGIGVAAGSAVGPVFIVGAGLDRAVEARQLTSYSLMMPASRLVGGPLLAAVTS